MSPLEGFGESDNIRDLQLDLQWAQRDCTGAWVSEARMVVEEHVSRVWQRLEQSASLDLSLGEETLTDLLLFEIALTGTREIRFWKSNRREESQTGIDWEWWIGSERGWLRYAVQAKKMDQRGFYPAIKHQVRGRYQFDVLNEYANDVGAIPLYCFYNYRSITDIQSFWRCGLVAELTQLGVTVARPQMVHALVKGERGLRRGFEWLHSNGGALPMRCLTCCPSILRLYSARHANLQHPLAEHFTLYESIPESVLRRLQPRVDDAGPTPTAPDTEGSRFDETIGPEAILVFDIGSFELPEEPKQLLDHQPPTPVERVY